MVALVAESKTVVVISPLGSVMVVVTGLRRLSLPEVRVTASPPAANSAAAAAPPNNSGGRLYQGSNPGSAAY